jgi:hypothetical protein
MVGAETDFEGKKFGEEDLQNKYVAFPAQVLV